VRAARRWSVAFCTRSLRIRHYKGVAPDQRFTPRWRITGLAGVSILVAGAIAVWVLYAGPVNHWLAVHTGTVNESGPYYGFWSGFGSDIAEFGVLGALATAIYQLIRKYNCHEPGCWRVGTHPAAGGQFLLCYRHHPDFHGHKPTHDLIVRMHREHVEQQAAIRERLREINQRVLTPASDREDVVTWRNEQAPATQDAQEKRG